MDFNDYEIPDEPKLTLQDEVTPDGQNKRIGRLAMPYNRDVDMVFVKKVESNDYDGHPLSVDVLDTLLLHGAELVFLYEADTGLVLEHTLDTYLTAEELEAFGGPARKVREQDAEYRWESLGDDLFTNQTFWGF